MAGFFKKLFNRISGKPAEEGVSVVVEEATLLAPEVVVEEPVAVIPKVKKSSAKKSSEKKTSTKKVAAKKAAPKVVAKKKSAPRETAPPLPSSQRRQEPSLKKTQKPVVKLDPRLRGDDDRIKHSNDGDIERGDDGRVDRENVDFIERKSDDAVKIEVVAPQSLPLPVIALPPAETLQRSGWFSRLKDGLSKSSSSISGSITSIFTKKKLDKATLQELEDTLIQADLGLAVAERIIAQVAHGRYDREVDPEEVKQILAAEVAKVLKPVEVPFTFGSEKPFVIAVVGVNGSGKTTTIGKLGSIAANEGFKVMFAAGDTFRAAAIEQLTIWGKRIGAETISRPTGADAAGLAFDALKEAQSNGTDILFIDTAGRLQNKAHLMDELDKMVRVIKKLDATAPHAVLLVLDATTGQNALAQAEIFTKVAGVTGLIMTKLDGTARGGILVAIAEKFRLPIHAIGVGESINDLQPFDAIGFARAIAGLDEK